MHPEPGKLNRRAMVIPLMICGLFVFCIVFFGVYQYQQQQMRWTRNTLEQRTAYFLADAAVTRGIARFVAQPYANRWYGPTPADDLLTGRKHSGLLDEHSEVNDDGNGPLVAGGSYTLLAEDRHDGEQEGLPLSTTTNLDFTELFARASVPGYGGPVSVLVYARLAIAPENGYLNPDPAADERIKKVIRYRVFTAQEIADKPYSTPGTDTAAVRSAFQWEIARTHENFLRNRLTFKDLRTKVDAAWNKPAPGATTYTDAQVDALFSGVTAVAQNSLQQTDSAAFNWWSDAMFRNYRLADAPVAAPEGMRFACDPAKLPDALRERMLQNVMKVFSGGTLAPLPDWTKLNSATPIDTGDKFMQRIVKNGQTAEDLIAEPIDQWTLDIGNCWRDEEQASIFAGHAIPYPAPPPAVCPQTSPLFADYVFLEAFQTTPPPTIIADMQAEVTRINQYLPAANQMDPAATVRGLGPKPIPYPIELYAQLTDPTGTLQDYPISAPELITYFGKYIEAPQAPFLADGGGDPGPAIPPDDPRPPKEAPDVLPGPPPPPPTGGGYVSGKVIP